MGEIILDMDRGKRGKIMYRKRVASRPFGQWRAQARESGIEHGKLGEEKFSCQRVAATRRSPVRPRTSKA